MMLRPSPNRPACGRIPVLCHPCDTAASGFEIGDQGGTRRCGLASISIVSSSALPDRSTMARLVLPMASHQVSPATAPHAAATAAANAAWCSGRAVINRPSTAMPHGTWVVPAQSGSVSPCCLGGPQATLVVAHLPSDALRRSVWPGSTRVGCFSADPLGRIGPIGPIGVSGDFSPTSNPALAVTGRMRYIRTSVQHVRNVGRDQYQG